MSSLAQLIVSIATLISAVGTIYISVRNGRRIEEVHSATNGLVTKLGNEIRASATAEGIKQGHEEAARAKADE